MYSFIELEGCHSHLDQNEPCNCQRETWGTWCTYHGTYLWRPDSAPRFSGLWWVHQL